MPTAIGVDAVTAITDRWIMPDIVDGVYSSNVLLYRWYNGRKIMQQGGTQFEQPVLYRKGTTGGWYQGLDRFALAPQDNIKNFVWGWKQCQQTVTISGLTLIVTDSDLAIANHIALQCEQAKMDMMEDLADGLFGGGGAVSGGNVKAIDGLYAVVDDGTNATVYGGVTRSGNPWASATNDLTTSTLTTFALRQRMGVATIGGNSPTIILSRQEQYDRYWKLLENKQSIQVQQTGPGAGFSDLTLAGAGFHNILFDGIPWVVDSHVKDGPNSSNSEIMFLNENMMNLVVSPRGNLVMGEWQTPIDMDAITAQLLWAGNLTCKSPRLNTKLTNISA